MRTFKLIITFMIFSTFVPALIGWNLGIYGGTILTLLLIAFPLGFMSIFVSNLIMEDIKGGGMKTIDQIDNIMQTI